ncbi:MAG TPA: helix-turn-helix domain-containing protein [Phycisphaerae bacterium]|nr:helix-turn-helix domain-containing protein [Phycisphaerae bacterium]
MPTHFPEAPVMAPNKNLLKTTEAAVYLDLEPVTLERWRAMRRGPKYCKVGRNVRYRRIDLDAFLTAQTIQTSMGTPE